MTYYPVLDDNDIWSVAILIRNAAADPDYLNESPYGADIVAEIEKLAGNIAISDENALEEAETGDKWEVLERQTKALYTSLMAEQKNLNAKDNAEKMSFFRTATSLLDKLVGIQERAANLAKIHQFHDTVLTIMDDLLDAGQRTEVMERLQKAIQQ